MSQLQNDIFEWTEGGQLKPEDAVAALSLAGVTPGPAEWRNFIRAFLLWTGVVLVAAGVIFFFAYNWSSLHRFAKFGLAEALLGAACLSAWHFGMDKAAGKASLVGAAVLTGALLALVGQTYQTGADPFELFAIWAALILPWTVAARFAPLWLLWIALIDTAVVLYFQERSWGLLGVLFGTAGTIEVMFAANLIALIIWEIGLAVGVRWLDRWGARVLGVITGGFATSHVVLAILDSYRPAALPAAAFVVWAVAMYVHYRYRVFDVFMLAGAALSVIVVIAVFLAKLLRDAEGFLLVGLVVVVLSAGAAWWIRHLVEDESV